MIKRITIILFVLFLVFSGVVYYFFVLNLRLDNQTHYDIRNLKCHAIKGNDWNFADINSGESMRRMLLLPHGSALICDLDVDGYKIEPTVVVGYFNEGVGEIVLIVKEEGNTLVLVINEVLDDQERLNGVVRFARE